MKTSNILSAAAAAAAASALLSLSAFAASGQVVVYAEKSTIGQGLTAEPVAVSFEDGDNGIDIVKRAAEVQLTESDFGSYVTGFADTDTGAEIPALIAGVVPEMSGRNADGWLCAYDYTAESGWSYFINDEYAMVGISDYQPQDGDVIAFKFTVYGYGSDLGIDNSSWGGAPALITPANAAELAHALAYSDLGAGDEAYDNAVNTLGTYGVSQQDIDDALELLTAVADTDSADPAETAPSDSADTAPAPDKGSPDTGAEGIAVMLGLAAVTGAAALISRKR